MTSAQLISKDYRSDKPQYPYPYKTITSCSPTIRNLDKYSLLTRIYHKEDIFLVLFTDSDVHITGWSDLWRQPICLLTFVFNVEL